MTMPSWYRYRYRYRYTDTLLTHLPGCHLSAGGWCPTRPLQRWPPGALQPDSWHAFIGCRGSAGEWRECVCRKAVDCRWEEICTKINYIFESIFFFSQKYVLSLIWVGKISLNASSPYRYSVLVYTDNVWQFYHE